MLDIQFTARNYELSKKEISYFNEKISKHEKMLEKATQISVIVDHSSSHRGVDTDFNVEIDVNMPNAFIKVEEKGNNVTELTDILDQSLKRRLRRYHDQFKRWTKEKPWKVKELTDTIPDVKPINEQDSYNDYVPQIKRVQYDNDPPMHPAEAIEKMELLGHNCFLFKNIETGVYAMIHREDNGSFTLVEPKSE